MVTSVTRQTPVGKLVALRVVHVPLCIGDTYAFYAYNPEYAISMWLQLPGVDYKTGLDHDARPRIATLRNIKWREIGCNLIYGRF